jgi:DNA-binding MarR family transcriptional regulator
MPTAARADTEIRAIDDLNRITAELHRVGLSTWLQLGLPMAQMKALVVLASSDGMSVTGLAHSLSVGEPGASQLVEQLVRRGYAERVQDVHDRRRVVVTPTQAGDNLVAELRQGRRQHMEEWLTSMDDADVETLARGLRALAAVAVGAQTAGAETTEPGEQAC